MEDNGLFDALNRKFIHFFLMLSNNWI
jgi:hypothetical protein